MRLVADRVPALIPWGWGINGAFSVVGATFAVFIAMNWGFSVTLLAGGAIYLVAAVALLRVRSGSDRGQTSDADRLKAVSRIDSLP